MSAGARLEAFLARLYTDPGARRDFLADPRGTAWRGGLADADIEALAHLDRVGLELAAESFEAKRSEGRPRRRRWWLRLRWPRGRLR